MYRVLRFVAFCFVTVLAGAATVEAGQRYELAKRASEIDTAAQEHPELGFVFSDPKTGKPTDIEHAIVDTRVPSKRRLVIWLMAYSPELFDRLAGYGLHGIQVHYANRWFGTVPPDVRDAGGVLGPIRLEAATGEDYSPLVNIPKPDGMKERARQFLRWLQKKNPQGRWGQFLTSDQRDVRWERVIMAGSSHGSTTAARFSMHQSVDRVVMFCGPRDNTETWQGGRSATPPHRFFGFTHVLDKGWQEDHYCRSWQLLKLNQCGDVVNVEKSSPPYENTRRLITDCDLKGNVRQAHSGVVPKQSAFKNEEGAFRHEAVWKYLFLHPVDKIGEAVGQDADCEMTP